MTYRISCDDPLYAKLIELVAEYPGADIDEIMVAIDGEHETHLVKKELQRAVENRDLTEADNKYWVMRYDGPPDSN